MRRVTASLLAAALGTVAACSGPSRLPEGAAVGARPVLPEPRPEWLPTVNIAPAAPWARGEVPTPAPGLQVVAFAAGLQHPRWLHVLPNGDVLVAETNAPERPDDGAGLKGWAMKIVMRIAGAAVPSVDRITLLRDADGDGRAETRVVFLSGLHSPFGMALVGDRFYVANTDAVREYVYTPGALRIEGVGRQLADLPAGPRNHHWTRSLVASPDGRHLYATVGSNSNVAEHGIEAEAGRAAIWEIDRASGAARLFATGLRNPNGMAWGGSAAEPVLWTVVNERDELGSDLVPDYLTTVRDGGFYGWPYGWWGVHVDPRVEPPRPDLVAASLVPDYALGTHVAPLGLAASRGSPIPPALAPAPAGAAVVSFAASPGALQGMFIGLHGSWNREPKSGYKVVFVPFDGAAGGRPSGPPLDVLGGFVSADGKARGRPVGVALDARGALLVADDVGNTVWRVTPR